MRRLTTLAITLTLAMPSLARAGSLHDFKKQEHTQRPRVTRDNCVLAYLEQYRMDPKDPNAVHKAEVFCAQRQKRHAAKTAEVVAKGASVAAGAAAVAGAAALASKPSVSGASRSAGPHGVAKAPSASPIVVPPPGRDPFAERPIFLAELGGGAMGDAGVGQAMVRGRFARDALLGAGVSSSLFATRQDWLSESDLGPIVYLDARHVEFGLQPSLLVSAGNGVRTELGGGARSYTTITLGRRFGLHFDPMLGYIGRQWEYDVKLGASYRFTPTVYGRVSFDHRDILDLGDLHVSQTGLNGAVASVGVQF